MLHTYTYKPEPVFHFRSSEIKHSQTHNYNPLDVLRTYGVELETDYGFDRDEYTDCIDNLGMPFYCKYDGSLEEGVEIVSHPCSLNYWKYDMRLKMVGRTAKQFGFKAEETDTCGYHIHVGRRGLGSTDLERRHTAAKLVLLVDSVWDELVKFSRRDWDELDHWAPRPEIPAGTQALVTRALRAGGNGLGHDYRYTAVNLTNDNTVEFRVFKGTLNRDTIIAALELVDNMCRYAMAHTPAECHSARWADILAVENHKALMAYCTAHGVA